jgi:hypothetical protein
MRQARLPAIHAPLAIVCQGTDPRSLSPGLTAVLRISCHNKSALNDSSQQANKSLFVLGAWGTPHFLRCGLILQSSLEHEAAASFS